LGLGESNAQSAVQVGDVVQGEVVRQNFGLQAKQELLEDLLGWKEIFHQAKATAELADVLHDSGQGGGSRHALDGSKEGHGGWAGSWREEGVD
jgi:hypothetical protein